ncbi:related to rRNA biogenesis protein rrp36 [Rhynchosporium agropyri]|uniref:rRNA biogenesis protein RRP36 n=1 Tax=Rhynchosporium agropyri TaxID=914238 RepID=A0A1E1LT64_9HELO|nr:related to rRNA biogenesis protein rrp36 [Rhynchosporium agropyri]
MSSIKRKAPEGILQRRVRPRRESSLELEDTREEELVEKTDEEDKEGQASENSDDGGESDSGDSEYSEEEVVDNAASITFGALAKAQALLEPGRKKITKSNHRDTWEDNEAVERKAGRRDHRNFNRSSKHAPTEISSKKAVSRKREVIPVIKRVYRDPRFETTGGPVDESKFSKAYAFLDDYREDEMKEIRTAIKSTKDEEAKEKLKRALLSMESKKKAQLRRNKEQEILDRHRKEEKELVKQGKQPFYLKKAEQKKRVLLDTFGELEGKQLDHVIERRRKKMEGKEKKKMPYARRNVE